MPVRQNVHADILKLSQELSAGNGDNFRNGGPEKSGKTTLANYLAQEHQRAVVRLDQLFDWCLKRGSQLAEEAQKYLDERQEELQV